MTSLLLSWEDGTRAKCSSISTASSPIFRSAERLRALLVILLLDGRLVHHKPDCVMVLSGCAPFPVTRGVTFFTPGFIPQVTSQHPYCEEFIGPPHVFTIDINNLSEVENVMKKIMISEVRVFGKFSAQCLIKHCFRDCGECRIMLRMFWVVGSW